jgi:hypothetical protein
VFTLLSCGVPNQPAFRSWETATGSLNHEAIRRSRTEFETAATKIIIREVILCCPDSAFFLRCSGNFRRGESPRFIGKSIDLMILEMLVRRDKQISSISFPLGLRSVRQKKEKSWLGSSEDK